MLTINTQFKIELVKLAEERLVNETEALVFGGAIKDFADYKYRVGLIAGLKIVIDEFVPEADKIISERN